MCAAYTLKILPLSPFVNPRTVYAEGREKASGTIQIVQIRSAGVREYWIVDPDKNRILVYNFASEDTGDYTFSETVKAGIYEDLEIDFSSIEI